MYNIIILNHFYGYPELEDEFINKQRYAKLLKLVNIANRNKTIFLENDVSKKDKRLASIRKISEVYGHKWLDFKDNHTIKDIYKIIQNLCGISINPENSKIILGGTNTSGCLLRSANIAAKNWAKLNYNVQFCLSMCGEYEIDGVNSAEKNQMAASILYQFIKNNNFTNKIDAFYDPRELVINFNN